MKRFIITLSVFSGIFALAYGAYEYFRRQIELALQYCYKISNVDVLESKKDSISLRLYLKIQNKSSIALNLKGYNLNFFLNGIKVANVVSNKEQIIYNNAISELRIIINFDPSKIFVLEDLMRLISYFITDKSKIVIDIKGEFKAAVNFLTINMPVDFRMNLQDLMTTDDEQIEKQKVKCDIK